MEGGPLLQQALVWKGWAQMPLIFRIHQNKASPAGASSFQGLLALSPGAVWLHLLHHGYSSSGLKPFDGAMLWVF